MTHYIRYCKSCIMPDTKPDLHIDESGVCNACRSYIKRQGIDWKVRKDELSRILDRYRSKNGKNYDCIIPISGGKDSFFQVITMLELGMNPLLVNATTDKLSALGRENLDIIKKLGVDCIEFTTNPIVSRRINKITLTQIGDISWPEHIRIFTIPIRVAIQYNVPLIIWGENSQNEYGGPASAADHNVLDRRWLEEFGGLLGLRVTDLLGQEGIEPKHLIPYIYPEDEDVRRVGVTGLFLGHYIPWDGYRNALVAQTYGFKTYHSMVECSMVNYENLDNCQVGVHDYFKYLKYGFARVTDLACLHIRRGRLLRSEAIELAQRIDGKFPWKYLEFSLEQIMADLGMTVDEFEKVCDRFTNKKIFVCDSRGNLVKDNNKNLTKINYDNIEEKPSKAFVSASR